MSSMPASVTNHLCTDQESSPCDEAFLRLAENSPDAIMRYDINGRILYLNRKQARDLEVIPAELIGRTTAEVWPDGRFTTIEQAVLRAARAGESSTVELEHKVSGGRWIYSEIRIVAERDDSGKILGVLAFGRDISRRKELLTHLEQSEREFRSLAENLPNNIARWDTEGRYLYVNPSHERLLGISNEALVGKRISEIFPQTPLVVVEAAIRRVATSGKPELLAGETVSEASGEERLHDIKLVPEFGPDGTVVSVLGLGLGRDMTELHLLQEAVSVRKQAFRSLAESSPDHIIRADRNHRIRYFNQKFMHVLGLRCSEEVLGRRHDEIWSGSRYATIAEAAARAIESGEQQTLELINPGKEGKRYHQIVVVPERGVDGAIIGTLAFCRDITAIRETEHRLRHFIYTLPGLAFVLRLTPEGQMSFPFTSPNILDLYGLTPEAVQDDAVPLLDHVLPDDRRRIEAAIAESAQTLRALRIEFRVHRPGLPESWVECRALPDLQPDGCTLWHGIMLDISERKQAQWRMELLERAINQSNEGFFLINEQTRFVDVNDAACRSLGYTREELLRLTPPDISPDFSRETVLELIRTGTKSPITFETFHRTKEGRIFPVELTCVTFIHEEGRYSLAMVREISERKQAEAAERAHLEEASRLQRVQTANELATLLAHEINQPLAAIATYAEASLMQLRNSPLAHDRLSTNLERIGKQAIRAGDSIRYMRNFIRRGHIDPVPMNLITVVQRAYDLQSANARGAGIRLEMKVNAELPPVSGVDVQVEQVLLNLLRNAQDAIHDAGMEEGSITVRAQQVERMIQVTVLDTGPGIDAARAEKLFDPLASTKAYGLGVGLRISRSLVEAHHGRLWVEPGTPGGCFHFTLPIAEEKGRQS